MDEDLEFKMIPHDNDGSRRVLWVVRGPAGATTFTIMRMPYIKEMWQPLEDWVQLDDGWYMGIDLGFHHRFYNPEREYASLMVECLALEGVSCYYEGTSLGGMELARQWRDANLDEGVIRAALHGAYLAEFTEGS